MVSSLVRSLDRRWDGTLPGTRLVFTRERTNYPVSISVADDGTSIDLFVDAVPPVDARALGVQVRTHVDAPGRFK